jgi:hypothetical protein
VPWLQRLRFERFDLMGDPVLADPLAAVGGERLHFSWAGSLPQIFDGLEGLDIGLEPQLLTEFSRCRCDVRFLMYASSSRLAALQHLDPYRHLAGTDAVLLFNDTDERIHHLDCLAVDRELAESTKPVVRTVEPLFPQASERPLTILPGLRQPAPRPWNLGIDNPADQRRLRGTMRRSSAAPWRRRPMPWRASMPAPPAITADGCGAQSARRSAPGSRGSMSITGALS